MCFEVFACTSASIYVCQSFEDTDVSPGPSSEKEREKEGKKERLE